jgi:hypothetical protein
MGEVLGQADITDDPRQTGDHFGGLDSPDGVDRAARVGGCHSPHHTIIKGLAASRVCAQLLRGVDPVMRPFMN